VSERKKYLVVNIEDNGNYLRVPMRFSRVMITTDPLTDELEVIIDVTKAEWNQFVSKRGSLK
jgi:hypothetical protein